MSSIISSKNFAIKTGGYGITTSPVDAANYFYISETNNGHGKDLDSLAATMMSTEDPKEQLKIMNELEKRHLDEVAIYVPTHNGPNFKACRKGLANYGPMLSACPTTPERMDQRRLGEAKLTRLSTAHTLHKG